MNLKRFNNPFSKSDVFIISGLSFMGSGLWMYEPWVSLTVCGVLLMGVGMIGVIREDKGV